MALSIKNEDAERLARQVAKETGESLTQAIEPALQERLQRLTRQRRGRVVAELLEDIPRRVDDLPTIDGRPEAGILGYDGQGCPADGDRHFGAACDFPGRTEAAGREFDLFLHHSGFEVVPVDGEHVAIARVAWRKYGRGRHRAGLDFRDCFAYALPKVLDEPLLFKGDDFKHTDAVPAAK